MPVRKLPKKRTPQKSPMAPKVKVPRVPKAPNKPKTPVQVLPPVVPPVPPPQVNEAEKIWDEIKNLPIQMFGLPGQYISQHAQPVPIEPSKLYLTIRSSATLPSLEAAIGDKYVVEQAARFVIVSRAPVHPVPLPYK